jgi:hypothetical protein
VLAFLPGIGGALVAKTMKTIGTNEYIVDGFKVSPVLHRGGWFKPQLVRFRATRTF